MMNFGVLAFLSLLFSACFVTLAGAQDELVMVQAFMRHTKRTPTGNFYDPFYQDFWRTVETYSPNNPFPDGKITKLGTLQMNSYGKFLHQTYINEIPLLPEEFDQNAIYFRSSAMNDRTMMSAPSIANGLYPEAPVPIYSVEARTDRYTFPTGNCPSYEIEYPRKIREMEQILNEEFSEFLASVAEVSGFGSMNFTALEFLDVVDQNVDNGLDHFQPNFAPFLYENAAEINRLRSQIHQFQYEPEGQNDPRGTIGATVMRLVIQGFKDAILGSNSHKLEVFIGHDIISLPALWISLGFGLRRIKTGSSLHLELWRRNDGEYYLEAKVADSNQSGLEYNFQNYELRCPTQQPRCPFDDFITHFDTLNPPDGCCHIGPTFEEIGCTDYLNPATAEIPACRNYRNLCPHVACGPNQVVDRATMRCLQLRQKKKD